MFRKPKPEDKKVAQFNYILVVGSCLATVGVLRGGGRWVELRIEFWGFGTGGGGGA